jgi:adenylate cyclase
MTEELLTELSTFKALRVISRTSVMHYKKTDKTLPEIARELKVKAVIEGSVQRDQDRVRIFVQLVKAEPEEHLLAKEFTRSLAKVLELQSEVAQAIAQEIRITVTSEEKKRLASSHPVNPEVHEVYLKGMFLIRKNTEADERKAISYLKHAIAIDSSYAPAYEGLALAYDCLLGLDVLPVKDAISKIKDHAEKASSLDGTLSTARILLGEVSWYEWNWKEAEARYRQAIELNPSDANGHIYLAGYYYCMNKFDKALIELKRAVELDPLNLSAKANLAVMLFFANQHDIAMQQIREVLTIDSNYIYGVGALGYLYLLQNNYKEAIVHYQKAIDLGDYPTNVDLACAYGIAGNKTKARQILFELKRNLKKKYLSPSKFALIYISLNEWDHAFECLEKAETAISMPFFNILGIPHGLDPNLDRFREDPRFHALLEKMGLEEFWGE